MNKKVVEKALSLVEQGYIYGAKGQTCSPVFRQQQAAQYPDQADNILGTGAKWDGKPVWDCAQLTRACAKEGGVTLVSGATSQWNKTDWNEYGPIETIPEGETVFLYRQQNENGTVMQHTGVALGDGTCVHARGTAYGVVRQQLDEYPWTHWARPDWPEEKEEDTMAATATVTAPTGTVNMRVSPTRSANLIDRLPIGTVVEVTAEVKAGDGEPWRQIRYNGRDGWMMAQYLVLQGGAETPQETPQDGQEGKDEVTVTLPRSVALALLEALKKAVDG